MFFWEEIYYGTDIAEFNRLRNLLESHNIPIRTKVSNTRGRMANNIIMGGNPLVLNTTGMNSCEIQQFCILTKYKYVVKARTLISQK